MLDSISDRCSTCKPPSNIVHKEQVYQSYTLPICSKKFEFKPYADTKLLQVNEKSCVLSVDQFPNNTLHPQVHICIGPDGNETSRQYAIQEQNLDDMDYNQNILAKVVEAPKRFVTPYQFKNKDEFPYIFPKFFGASFLFGDYTVSISDKMYVISNSNGEVLSVLYDESCDLKVSPDVGCTCGYILDNNTLVIYNRGTYSVVLITKS